MSNEHFQTLMTADVMSPDGQRTVYGRPGEGRPRWQDEPLGRGWATTYLYAHEAIEIAAERVAEDVMQGLTGDHPDRRAYIANVLRACAHVVRKLAADAAHDGTLTNERWDAAIAQLRDSIGIEAEQR